MSFSAPLYLIFLLSIPGIIILYMLKKKYTEQEISSLYLWERVLKDIEVSRPWQKLRKNLLLLLQILALLFLVLGLSGPYIFSKNGGSSVVVVMDATGSMGYRYEGSTRFERAREEAKSLIRGLSPSARVSLISYGMYPSIILNDGKRGDALEVIGKLKATSYGGDFGESLPFVKSLLREKPGSRAYFFTDGPISLEGINGESRILSSEVSNLSLEFISSSREGDKYKALVRVVNTGKEALEGEITLYGDDRVAGIKKASLQGGETKTVYFENIPVNIKSLRAEMDERDDLMGDNYIYDVVKTTEGKRILYVGDKNVFLERALGLFKDVEFFKSREDKKLPEGYDFYVFDGIFPESLPNTGNLMIINPTQDNPLVKVLGGIKAGEAEMLKTEVTKFMEGMDFSFSKGLELQASGLETAIKSGDKAICLFGSLGGRRVVVLGLDLHDSDFPLKEGFPIFIHNALGYLTEAGALSKPKYISGERVEVLPRFDAKEAFIEFPSGTREEIKLAFPSMGFAGTRETGIYTLLQNTAGKEYKSIFAVNFPSSESKNEAGAIQASGASSTGLKGGTRDIQFILLLLALLALLAEWGVLVHES